MEDEVKVTEELAQAQTAEAAAQTETAETASAAEAEPAKAAETEAAKEAPAAEKAAPAESMADYEAELNASLKQIHEGDVLTGTVIGVSDTEVTLDLKYYTEGVIRVEDFTDDPNFNVKEEVHIGDEISATVVRRDGGQGQIMLSRKEANDVLAWDRLKTLMEKQTIIKTKVAGVVKAGVVVYVEGIRGFVPASKLSLNYVENLEEWLGKEVELRVIDVNEEDKKLILSAREILREREAEEKKARISNVEVGLVTEGTVESLQPYGAFINLGNGLSGLVHVSQISEKRIKSPSAVLKVGDKVKVKVIAVKDGKLSLSMKALQDVAAEEIQEETIELPKSEDVSTNLGSLFAKLKL
ncbi:S1 RNA binding domain protein [Marvinbryantia formatexigens DSM 14469]|uniref:S1 RNA binding domain protein n=1 Tax=Marvinbryantia formatexigens DSM 14469 TaxID=478749 RepID=C6LB27_9FIRM|nr:S1 RNA-binding domain-containing protein [Marvinbryantia formatexigens]EET62158.1 S1 RNA binding domain protein [Marvinbryantia formatexigens DSM 14469]SDF78354.1 small subunit ribosomal protein S1 [Marvinbryantia formatexigens]